MPRLADLRFRLLAAPLRRAPAACWHLAALLLATARCCVDRRVHAVAGDALRALGRPAGRPARWRFAWALAYHRELDLLLVLLADRLTPAWAARHVRCAALPPADGALLLTLHHANKRLALPALRHRAPHHPLGAVSATPTRHHGTTRRDLRAFAAGTAVPFPLVAAVSRFLERQVGATALLPHQAARGGLRLLRSGGWLLLTADPRRDAAPDCAILGKAMALPRGPRWLAERSGKPILPYLIIPAGLRWRLWLGEPVTPTPEALGRALECCIRRAPAACSLEWWEEWRAAPPATCPRREGDG